MVKILKVLFILRISLNHLRISLNHRSSTGIYKNIYLNNNYNLVMSIGSVLVLT